ncbi:MAG: DUF2800 domain-containing protein [Gemmatimonadota bacterium]
MTPHGKKPPSSLQRLALCPGSARQAEGIPDEPGEYAVEGSRLHGLVAGALKGRPGRLADDAGLYGNIPEVVEGGEHNYAVENCLAFVDRMERDWFPGGQRHVEEALDLNCIHPDVEVGTADYISVRPFVRAFLADWKFGYNEVPPARDNLQLRAYAVGAWHQYEVSEVEVALINGFTGWGTRWKYTEPDLVLAEQQLRQIVEAACIPWAPLLPSAEACRYCRANLTCPALLGLAKSVEGKVVPDLSPGELGKLMVVAETVELWCRALKGQAWKIVMAGGTVPGWMQVTGRPTRDWASGVTIAQLQGLAESLGKDPNTAFRVEAATPSQIEKAWGKAKAIKEALSPLIVSKPGAPKLVQEGAKDEQG